MMILPCYLILIISVFLMIVIDVGIGNPTNVRLIRQTQSRTDNTRIDCYSERESLYSNFSKQACLARNCLFDDQATSNDIPCYLPPNYGYILQGNEQQTSNDVKLSLKRNQQLSSPFPQPIENVNLDVQYYTNDIIRFRLYDADQPRYEVPIPLTSPLQQVSTPQYTFSHSSDSSNNNILSFAIKRKSNGVNVFDTSLGGLVLCNQYLQIVSRLQSPHVYGFGENNHKTLKHDVTNRTIWGIFPRDQGTFWNNNTNHYGTYPFYLVMEQNSTSDDNPSGSMHGVLLINSNAMDYSFGPEPSVTIRTIGGILDFFVFLGPQPEQIVQQYTWLVGRPIMPPYWSLGFHISRWDYGNLTHMKMINQKNRDAGVPFDVQYADIDYMDGNKDFTIHPINYRGLKEFFAQLNADGIRTVIILDPGTFDDQNSYTPTVEGIKQDVYINWANGSAMKGACWPGELYTPDFFKNRTHTWWKKLIHDFYQVNLTFDGLWIDMNEPAMFGTNDDAPWNWYQTGSNYTLKCPQSDLDDPPYRTKAAFRYDGETNRTARLSDRTLCMSGVQGEITSSGTNFTYYHYDVHSLYGWSQTKPTLDALRSLTSKRGFVLARSTFVGSGQWTAHWLGDNGAHWYLLKESLIGMIEFNWFGIPMVGADICGYDGAPTEEMCIRWQQVGAFYPYARNHNNRGFPDQDPGSWSASATLTMITALQIRYTLLPYYYTLFYHAHTNGSTVVRPLFHEFPTERSTLDIYLQFLVGPSIMIAPVTDDGARQVQAYIPSAVWYDYYNGNRLSAQKQSTTLDAPLDKIPILLRGGSIIPTQGYANNTRYSREKPFGLLIVLDENGNANGDLFYDDGESIDTIESKSYFYAKYSWSTKDRQLQINVIQNSYSDMSKLILDSFTIYGTNQCIKSINVNNKQVTLSRRPNTQIGDVSGLGLSMNNNFTVTWINQTQIISSNPQSIIDCYDPPHSNESPSNLLSKYALYLILLACWMNQNKF